MNKDETMRILKKMQDDIEHMTTDGLFYYMNNTSKTFRKEIDNLEKSLENPQMKIKVIEFDNFSLEERQMIQYYMVQSKIEEINFICKMYKNDLSPVLMSLLKKRKKALKMSLDDEYEVV